MYVLRIITAELVTTTLDRLIYTKLRKNHGKMSSSSLQGQYFYIQISAKRTAETKVRSRTRG